MLKITGDAMNLSTITEKRREILETADFFRIDASSKLNEVRRSELGQFMTPAPIAAFMASLFNSFGTNVRLLDPGAAVGSLSAAVVDRICKTDPLVGTCSLVGYEVDEQFEEYLESTFQGAKRKAFDLGIGVETEVRANDFIIASDPELFDEFERDEFTHVITNPPYKKLNAKSAHRLALRNCGIETSNLYAAFLYLAAKRLMTGGEMVAIVPRSFCNGPYFKDFRLKFFGMMNLQHLHVFESRSSAFKGDSVLQENLIFHATKSEEQGNIRITTSRGGEFEYAEDGSMFANDMTVRDVPPESVFPPGDRNRFVFIASNEMEQAVVTRMAGFQTSLEELGVEVSTGPVVDFRLKPDLRSDPESGAVPLLYPAHFRSHGIEWPREMKKPNAINVSDESRRWLWKNEDYYVVTKRFTTKEEKRRVVASVYDGSLPGELIGFENHLNVFHSSQRGLDERLARGLALYLNSSLVDRYFRLFNGHTQVNATDLRFLSYPAESMLIQLGKNEQEELSQQEIDAYIDKEVGNMADEIDPIQAQKRIDEALQILKALGVPKGQQNKRSALTLLAIINLSPNGSWEDLERPLIGITPIMEFCKDSYGETYAPNTRETFRRQTMHQFVEAGIALYNPDKPDRPPNSPKACYQISEEAYVVMKSFGLDSWEKTLAAYLEGQPTLAAKWAKHRDMQMVPVQIEGGGELNLAPGVHSELIKDIIKEFAPRFAPAAEVIYVGDTGDKVGYFREERLAELGVSVDKHGKMPDVVLYFGKKNWLLLVESVTSHGPVDSKRYDELKKLFADSSPGLVFVTAFPDRAIMGRFLGEISWETEVWCADAPTHLIHFNGERFLGPYETND